jgi:hypothetical protein
VSLSVARIAIMYETDSMTLTSRGSPPGGSAPRSAVAQRGRMLGCYADVGVDSFVTPRTREATSAMGMRFVTVESGRIDCRTVFDPSHAPDGQGIA